MKGGQNFRDMQQKKQEKEEAQWVKPQPCLICGKTIEGAYAQHQDGWTCCGKCMREQDKRTKYPGHTEEDFFNRNLEADNATLSSQHNGEVES